MDTLKENSLTGRNLKRSRATLYFTVKETLAHLSITHFMVENAKKMPGTVTKMSKQALLWGISA